MNAPSERENTHCLLFQINYNNTREQKNENENENMNPKQSRLAEQQTASELCELCTDIVCSNFLFTQFQYIRLSHTFMYVMYNNQALEEKKELCTYNTYRHTHSQWKQETLCI